MEVQAHVVELETTKCLLQILNMVSQLLAFDDHVVYIDLHVVRRWGLNIIVTSL